MPLTEILLGSFGGAMVLNKVIDYIVPTKYQPQFKAQKERDERLEEFQKRQQKENQMFQAERDAQQQAFQMQRDAEQRNFQMEMEANRMAYQERIEMRRLQVQKQLEEQRNELTIALNKMNIENSREIARFNAVAMRETQILVARENAQNLLQDHMVQDALKNFPLNISPLVLLKSRPHSLSSLLRFTIGEDCNMTDVANDVVSYAGNPEALNVFVAPVYVDSKIKNRELLSRQIWDTTYQRLESFSLRITTEEANALCFSILRRGMTDTVPECMRVRPYTSSCVTCHVLCLNHGLTAIISVLWCLLGDWATLLPSMFVRS